MVALRGAEGAHGRRGGRRGREVAFRSGSFALGSGTVRRRLVVGQCLLTRFLEVLCPLCSKVLVDLRQVCKHMSFLASFVIINWCATTYSGRHYDCVNTMIGSSWTDCCAERW